MSDMTDSEKAEFEAMRQDAPADPPKPADPPAAPEPAPAPAEPVASDAKAAQPEPAKPAAAPEPAKPAKPERMVPLPSLLEERNKRQALERELNELKGKLSPPAKPAASSSDEEPDEQADPIGTIAWLKGQLKQGKEQAAEAERANQQVAEIGRRLKARLDPYIAEHPEYPEQLAFLRQSRARELEIQGYGIEDIYKIVAHEELVMGATALERDADPGAFVAALATHRGWKAKEPEPQPNPEPAAPDPKPAVDKLARLERGQRAAVTSSAGGGSGPEPEMTMERLLQLDGAAFAAAWEKHAKKLMA